MTARAIIEAAIEQIDTYKYPNIDEAREFINSILQAAKLGSTGNDAITRMEFRGGSLDIETSYSVRCCAMTDDFHIPKEIINADDPIKAATRWAAEKELAEARKENEYAKSRLIATSQRLQTAIEDLAALPG